MACGCQTNTVYPLELHNIVHHNAETISYDFKSILPLSWYEGDSSKLFIHVNGERVGKKFSYATLPSEDIIRFTTRIRENRSAYKEKLAKLTIGDLIDVSEPSGEFWLKRDGRPALLLSNGVGIAAMRSLIKAFIEDSSQIRGLTQINIDRDGNIYKDEFDQFVGSHPQFTSIYTSTRNEFYQQVDFECQKLMLESGIIPNIYIVGSDNFVIDTMNHAMHLGFGQEDIVTDGSFDQLFEGGCDCSSTDSGGCGCGCSCG